MAMYDSLGTLMRETLTAYRNCDPQLLLQHLDAKDAGRWLLKKCKGAMVNLYSVEFPAKPSNPSAMDAWRANYWNDAKYEMLLPNYTKPADKEILKKVQFQLKAQPNLVDDALREANLGDNWNPEHQTPYSQG